MFFENFLMRLASGRALLLSFVATFICIMIFGQVVERLGTSLLDSYETYDYAEVMRVFMVYGAEGRTLYAISALTLDTIFPLAYGAFFAGLLMRFRIHRWAIIAVYVLLLGLLVDFAENIQFALLLTSYPDITADAVNRVANTTMLKWLLLNSARYFMFAQIIWAIGRWCTNELKKI